MKLKLLSLLLILCTLGCIHRQQYKTVHDSYRIAMVNYLTDPGLLKAYYDESNTDTRKVMRNRIINWCIWLSDDRFARYEVTFSNSRALVDIGSDLAALGTTGATTVVASPAILGAIATGIQGAKASINKNLFDQQTRSAIIAEMEACRKNRLISLYQGETLADTQYSLEQGLIDVQAYDNAGTIQAALVDISQRASQSQIESTNKLRTLKREP